ncbi:MAG: zf-HC2 domain-containing protein [Candidatus Acidiferrales bacterium]
MKCKALISELADYFDEGIDPALRAEIEEHLAKCTNCRVVVNTCKKTIEIFCNSEPTPLPTDTRERLYQALEKKLRHARP